MFLRHLPLLSTCLFERTPLYSLSLNSTVAPTEFSVARTSFSPWRLVPSKILCPLIVSNHVLGPVLCPHQPPRRGWPPSSASVPPPMVWDPGLSPFKDILHRCAPKLRRGCRPSRGRPRSRPPDLSLVLAPTPLLEIASAPLRRNPRRLVRRVLPTPSSTPLPPRRPRR